MTGLTQPTPISSLAAQTAPPLQNGAADLPGDAASGLNQFFFLELGFSFMVGLAMGFALKIAFKIALVVVGLILLALFALQYQGLIEINWSGVEGQYDGLAAGARQLGGAFLGFVGEHLSSAASFTAGFLLGLRL